MLQKFWISLVLMAGLTVAPAQASLILINEILADPAAGVAGDANQDGTTSSRDDEFVELYNPSGAAVDLSGWYLSDSVSRRHTFTSGTELLANEYLVVFGGGNTAGFQSHWYASSTGNLGLNNESDTVYLYDSIDQLINEVSFGSLANHNQSIVRDLEGQESEFVLHSSISQDLLLFSPGLATNPNGGVVQPPPTAAVPEPSTLAMIMLGSLGLGLKRRFA